MAKYQILARKPLEPSGTGPKIQGVEKQHRNAASGSSDGGPRRTAKVPPIGYPRMKASGESSTTKHRLLHASGPHPIPPPNDPKYEKRPNKRDDRKVLVSEESNKNWADSDSETTSSSSSSESEQEEVHCLMANQTTDDEVFDFSNTEFTREDLINALNEMVHEYRKLSQTFEEIKAENGCLTNISVESSTAQLEDTDSLQTELRVPASQDSDCQNCWHNVAKNKNITVEEVVDEPVVKKAAPKRRPAPAIETIEPVAVETESRIDVSAITNYDEEEPLVETEKEAEGMTLEKITDSEDTEHSSKIPENMMFPFVTAAETTKIKFGLGIEITGVNDGDWHKSSLPQIAIADKGKAPHVEKDEIKGHPAGEMFSLICADIEFLVQLREKFSPFGHLKPVGYHTLCTDLVVVGPVVDRSGIPKRTFNKVQYDIRIVDSFSIPPSDTVSEELVVNISTDHTDSQRHPDADSDSSTSIPIDFVNEETADAQTSTPTAIVSSNDYTNEFEHLRASVHQISLEQVQTKFHIEKLKAALFTKISSLETAFLTRSDNQDMAVLVHNDFLHKEMKDQKAALSQELDVICKEVQDQKTALSNDLMEFRVQAQDNFNTLTAQLSELVAYINRGGDAKKGEMSSGRVPPPPGDQNRPGGGSRSEPSRKRGSGSQSSSRQRGFRYWLGGDRQFLIRDSEEYLTEDFRSQLSG
ncbi:hypothetical protein F511_40450 [Dorcoceras hygrometricum]|uniref:Uncharacterized protein n=1 Tax=Dorcoceras hygrometricum TaxID=472368 RepID=A0A2Z7AHB8_9LAMI|nr:hypothetical protein F511_40450 [Dorcoceras hygrometricum]